ncbi:MAG TPA: OsmC family protein [Oscillospiraceae bacterium]|nr:OsmC family protein [Oscillospiraceae bacterium]HPF57128.1 OsmC family protein [Clostridiales bacterium]HPK35508.1 OsmC family protein [Oscillospiraceae bacterium]HPR76046.1 OsmC family protein [Oscillospiraceae bacterium]
MPNIKFGVTAKSENNTKTVVTTRGFTMTIDEPESLGGTNGGANPVEYLLAALSGCLNVVGHLVAGEMGFRLNGLEIDLQGDLDPAKFTGQSTSGRAGYNDIRVTLMPDTDANQETLDKWLKTVESRCPVSDNIANPTPLHLMLG